MTNKHDWLLKKTPRSVDAMKLWPENPRLNSDEEYLTIVDFISEMTHENADRDALIDLAKSISKNGFIPADPVVLWQDEENKRYYVAEGNRRVLVLKLLRNPRIAPKSIRATITKLSNEIDKKSIAKIPVCVAPSFEDAEWYISQRNSMTSLQRRWMTEQQLNWVMKLFDKYNGDIQIIQSKIDLSESELKKHIRILKLKSLVNEGKELFSNEEFERASSMRFPITTLERFFSSAKVREQWGLEFVDYDFEISSNRKSFLNAFAEVIKRMTLEKGNSKKIDSRTLNTAEHIEEILNELPPVSFEVEETSDTPSENSAPSIVTTNGSTSTESSEEPSEDQDSKPKSQPKDDPNRNRLIHESYHIESDQFRIVDMFNELKRIPLGYQNSVAASIRIFLDLSVLNYIKTADLQTDIQKQFKKQLREITLKQRLEFIKQTDIGTKAKSILGKFLLPDNMFSLDVLNGYQHNNDTHFLDKVYLNKFWNFLFPLFQQLVVITEDE